MLIPDNCALIFVDAASSLRSTASFEIIAGQVQRLIRVARIAKVPTIIARYPADAMHTVLADAVSPIASMPTLPFHPMPAAWPSTELGRAIAATGRDRIVIAGLWLEEAVTLLSLDCLSVGFDTYVTSDATAVIDPAQQLTARARLAQAGAVPTSTEQIIREWAALLDDIRTAAELIACVQPRPLNSL